MHRRLFLLAAFFALILQATARAQDSDSAWWSSLRHELYIPDHPPALHARVWSTFTPAPGVLADRVTYFSADGMLVPAIVYRPDPKLLKPHTKLPGMVIVNGHGSDKFGWYAFYSGVLFAKSGAVVVTYDPIGEGERNAQRLSRQSPSPHEKDVTPPSPLPHDDWGQRVAGLMQVDLMQAVAYLDAQPEVDPKRIAVLGYSMGAYIAGIAGALDAFDHRIHAVLLSAGGVYDDGTGGYFDTNRSLCQSAPWHALAPSLTLDGKSVRGTILYLLNAQRGPMLVMNGDADTVMNIAHYNAEWFAAMRMNVLQQFPSIKPENLFTTVMYPGISHRPSWLNHDGLDWLNQQIHFAFWNTDGLIAAQGTTHISTWITANHVDISPNYFREDREGGIEATGTGIPALTRAQLTVLPDADWQRLQPQLTYEAWAAKAFAAEQSAAAHVH